MSGLPQGGFGGRGRPGRRRALVVGAVVLVLLLGWSYGVITYGGGEERAGEAAIIPEDRTNPEPTSLPGTTRSQPQAVPDDIAYATSPEERQRSSAVTPETPAEAPPGAHDPLGTGASVDDLAEIDQERVRFAAARFVSAAYGYSGRDKDAYNQGVGATVVWPVFYESAGATEIERYAARVEETGTKSGALLTGFEVEETTPDTASGYAYFDTGDGYGPNGELTGEKRAYRQHMTLERSGAAWSVRATEKIEEA